VNDSNLAKQLDRIPKIQMLNSAQVSDLMSYLKRECGGNDPKLRKFLDYAVDLEWREPPTVAAFREISAQLFYSDESRARGCVKCDHLGYVILTSKNAQGLGVTGAAPCPCRAGKSQAA
jgi:hypothetical protein